MKATIMQCKLWYVALCLLPYHIINVKVYPQPGENLWRLTARIGACVDAESTKLDWLESQQDLICSKIEKIDNDLLSHNDVVCSKLEIIDSAPDILDSSIDTICPKIENLD
ncbi:MAG: hypothetical protein WCD44_00025, partial [Candidatus Babeliales bacterium]